MAAASSVSDTGAYLNKLLKKAEDFCGDSFYTVTVLYRNKPESYFTGLTNSVMTKILKDNGGDSKSPINGRLAGVFFMASLRGGQLPTMSPFGNTRICIPIEAVFDDTTNLYFTDFFCLRRSTHYITLVLTKKGSKEDTFCQENQLPLLDPSNNKFFKRGSGPTFYTSSRSGLFVEVFYTEDVDIESLKAKYGEHRVCRSTTAIFGQGHSTEGGLRKNGSCTTCNVSTEYERMMEILRSLNIMRENIF